MERDRLEAELARDFSADSSHCRVVARQASDLADSSELQRDFDIELTVETVVSNLQDAPVGLTLRERWNWWLGAITVTHDGYERFTVQLVK